MARKLTEHSLNYIKKYDREVYKQYILKFSRKYEQDIIAYMDSIPNRRQHFLKLIRDDMNKNR